MHTATAAALADTSLAAEAKSLISSCAGSGKGRFSAYQRGSVWPCGETKGKPLISL